MLANYIPDPHAKNLPDAYKKTKDSNNHKILAIESDACFQLRETLREIGDILNINNATGATLDLYGERVGQERGAASDEKYLVLIKAKLSRDFASGGYDSILKALSQTFDCDPSEILISDGENPCTVEITKLPLETINKAGLTTAQTVAIIESMLPVGVTLESFLFDGTFTFSSVEDEYDETAGFANAEGTIGGYFGAAAGDEKNEILPI